MKSRHFSMRTILPSKWRFYGHAVVIIYILAFPTLMSVMTDYQPRYKLYVTSPNDQYLVEASHLRVPPLVLVDGHRVGLRDNQPVNADDPGADKFASCELTVAREPGRHKTNKLRLQIAIPLS